MMPSPIDPAHVRGLDVVLCTHRHSDHMDPGTLPLLAAENPICQFVVPRAEAAGALKLGLPEERLIPLNAGERWDEGPLHVQAIAAAHEEIRTNDRGEHHYLGYVLRINGMTLFHAGDGVPYPGLSEALQREGIDLALMPVNGRDAERRAHGILGNYTCEEAVQLCREVGIPALIPHHFGMFDFNTVNVHDLVACLERNATTLKWFLLDPTIMVSLS
jgi:L-ascorbate metabolism protein UlaG (beta-lactamase superfamily)